MAIRKINIVNEQAKTEKLLNQLERGDYDRARITLNQIQKSAQNRLDYLERRARLGVETGAERVVLWQEITRARQELKRVKFNVQAVRDTIKREELINALNKTGSQKLYGARRAKAEHQLKEIRAGLRNERGVKNAVQDINEYEAKREAAQIQERRYKAAGTTTRTVKAGERLKALWANMIYSNSDYNLPEDVINYCDEIFKKYFGFGLKNAIQNILSQVNSDKGSDFVYEKLTEIVLQLEEMRDSREWTKQELAEINDALMAFSEGVYNG